MSSVDSAASRDAGRWWTPPSGRGLRESEMPEGTRGFPAAPSLETCSDTDNVILLGDSLRKPGLPIVRVGNIWGSLLDCEGVSLLPLWERGESSFLEG